MESGGNDRKAQMLNPLGWVLLIVTALGALLLIFGGIFPTLQKFGVVLPEETVADMQRNYVISNCNGWLDAGGLEISYNPQLYDAVKAAKLGWDEFCSPEAIKDPMKRCTCVKACTKAVSADKRCSLNPNVYKPDLFVPSDEDPERGTVTTSSETKENVSFSRAGTYCFLDFIRSLKDIDRTCRPESDTGNILSIQTQVSYTHDPIDGYGTVTPNSFWGTVGAPIPEITEMKVTCLATCKVSGGCTNVALSVNYGCVSYKPTAGSSKDKEHCCARSVTEYPGSRQIVPEKSIPVSNAVCLDPAKDCPTPTPGAENILLMSTGDSAENYELIRMDEPAKTCDSIAEGETCSKEFIVGVPGEVYYTIGLTSRRGVNTLENLEMICKGMYQGDLVYSENPAPMAVLSTPSIYYYGGIAAVAPNFYKAYLCKIEGDEATDTTAPCRRISESMGGVYPGAPFNFNKQPEAACT